MASEKSTGPRNAVREKSTARSNVLPVMVTGPFTSRSPSFTLVARMPRMTEFRIEIGPGITRIFFTFDFRIAAWIRGEGTARVSTATNGSSSSIRSPVITTPARSTPLPSLSAVKTSPALTAWVSRSRSLQSFPRCRRKGAAGPDGARSIRHSPATTDSTRQTDRRMNKREINRRRHVAERLDRSRGVIAGRYTQRR